MGPGKSWFSPKERKTEGCDGKADGGGRSRIRFNNIEMRILTNQHRDEYLEYFSQTFPQFPQVSGPSSEDVDSVHKQYMAAFASLYLKQNDDEQVSLVIT